MLKKVVVAKDYAKPAKGKLAAMRMICRTTRTADKTLHGILNIPKKFVIA